MTKIYAALTAALAGAFILGLYGGVWYASEMCADGKPIPGFS